MEAQQDARQEERQDATAREADGLQLAKDLPRHPQQEAEATDADAPDALDSSIGGAPGHPHIPASNPVARFLRRLGPGLISDAADDDPTGIATYAQAGASVGYGLLWTTLLTLPMMMTVQYIWPPRSPSCTGSASPP
jgi:hypothetical protein